MKTRFAMYAAVSVSAIVMAVAAIASARPAFTPPLEFVTNYEHELSALEEIRGRAERDQVSNPQDFASCIRNLESWKLELSGAIGIMKGTHLAAGDPLDKTPGLLAQGYEAERDVLAEMSDTCAKFIGGPREGLDYNAIAVNTPKLTARLDYISHSIFQGSILVFATLIDSRSDTHNHANHLTITRDERNALVNAIDRDFGTKLTAKEQNWGVSAATVLRAKLLEFSCSDDPWE